MNFTNNMGKTDRKIRTVAGVSIVTLAAAGLLKGRTAKALLALATIFISTSSVGWCPAYAVAGVDTIPEAERMEQFGEKVFNLL